MVASVALRTRHPQERAGMLGWLLCVCGEGGQRIDHLCVVACCERQPPAQHLRLAQHAAGVREGCMAGRQRVADAPRAQLRVRELELNHRVRHRRALAHAERAQARCIALHPGSR